MKKTFMLAIVLLSFIIIVPVCYADLYALFDKETGVGKGVTEIKPDCIAGWAEKYTAKKVPDRSYQGLQGYEIKLDNGELRKATAQEIQEYIEQKEAEQEAVKKAKDKEALMDLLDDEDVKVKIKNIKDKDDPVMMNMSNKKSKWEEIKAKLIKAYLRK